ncbi:MAG: hypothetical protein AAFR51_03860 [Pseudomonadota bacterium]
MLGISNLPIDLEARMEARLRRREAETNAEHERPRNSDIQVPKAAKAPQEADKEKQATSENQKREQTIEKEVLVQTNQQVLPDLKVVIATLERALQADPSPPSNQRIPEIIGDAEPEWIRLLQDILVQLNTIRDALEIDISADVAKQNPEAIFSTRRYLRKMVDGSAMSIGTAATVLSAHIIAHALDRLTGTTIATDLIYKYKQLGVRSG